MTEPSPTLRRHYLIIAGAGFLVLLLTGGLGYAWHRHTEPWRQLAAIQTVAGNGSVRMEGYLSRIGLMMMDDRTRKVPNHPLCYQWPQGIYLKLPEGLAPEQLADLSCRLGNFPQVSIVKIAPDYDDAQLAEFITPFAPAIKTIATTMGSQIGDQTLAALLLRESICTKLMLNGTAVTDAGLEHLANCPQLMSLTLGHTAVTDASLAHLAACSNLRYLHLPFTAVTDAGLEHLVHWPQLMSLDLGHTAVTDASLAHLTACRNLEVLLLPFTAVTDAGLKYLGSCPGLYSLNLGNTMVTDAGLKYLSGCQQLTELSLDNTAVTDAGLAQLRDFPLLYCLKLDNTAVTDAGLA